MNAGRFRSISGNVKEGEVFVADHLSDDRNTLGSATKQFGYSKDHIDFFLTFVCKGEF